MTVADLIRISLRKLGVLAAEESPSTAEEADAFATLNSMLDSWAGERLALFATLRSTHTLTPSLAPHTMGTGGTFNVTRPVRIERASISASGGEMPIQLLSDAEWQNTQGKTSVGTPTALWVETAYPLLKLHLNPIPNAADTLVLYTWQQLSRFAATSDTFALPPGYERALQWALAKELAPEFGVALAGEAADNANESKSTIKRLNAKPSYLRCDPAVLSGGGFNLVSGDR